MTDTCRQRDMPIAECGHQRSTRTMVLFVAVLAMAGLPTTLSYKVNVPKIARPQAFPSSRTSLSEHQKDVPHEKSFTARPPSKRSSSSKVAMTSAVIDHTVMPTFERRMRDMALKNEKKVPRTRTSNLPPNVKMVTSLEEYKQVVGDEREKLVVARFYAPWCKACKAIQPMYFRMANTFTNVVFVEVPVTDENATLHQGLGVPSLPYGHIYHPQGGLVEELSISRKFITQFANKLQSYVTGSCQLKDLETASPYSCDLGQSEDYDDES